MNEPHAISPDSEPIQGQDYVAALHGLVRVETAGGRIEPTPEVLGYVEEIARVGKEAPSRVVQDYARWALESFTQGGCGSKVSTMSKELLGTVGHPSDYVEGLMASV